MTSHRIKTAAHSGIYNQIISIEANFVRGYSGLTLIGSNSEICRGGLLRAQSALEKHGINLPQKKMLMIFFQLIKKKKAISLI